MSEIGRRKVGIVAERNSAGRVQNNAVTSETEEEVTGTLEGDRFKGEANNETCGLISMLDITNSINEAEHQLNFTEPVTKLPARKWMMFKEVFRKFLSSDISERFGIVDDGDESDASGVQNNGLIMERPSRVDIDILSRDNSTSGCQNNAILENVFGDAK